MAFWSKYFTFDKSMSKKQVQNLQENLINVIYSTQYELIQVLIGNYIKICPVSAYFFYQSLENSIIEDDEE